MTTVQQILPGEKFIPPTPGPDWQLLLIERVASQDENYQSALAEIRTHETTISELNSARKVLFDNLADASQDEQIRLYDEILAIDREITVAQSSIAKIQRTLPDLEKQACIAQFEHLDSRYGELKEASDSLVVSEDVIKKLDDLPFADHASRMVMAKVEKHRAALGDLNDIHRSRERLRKLLALKGW